MSNVLNFPAIRTVPESEKQNPFFSYVDTAFDEKRARLLTWSHEPDKKPQDQLVYAFLTVGRTTGYAIEFGWASGRQDVFIEVDLPAECVTAEKVAERAELIEQLKEKYHGKGFAHHEYDGGFDEFPQNFERVTGKYPEALRSLFGCKRASAA